MLPRARGVIMLALPEDDPPWGSEQAQIEEVVSLPWLRPIGDVRSVPHRYPGTTPGMFWVVPGAQQVLWQADDAHRDVPASARVQDDAVGRLLELGYRPSFVLYEDDGSSPIFIFEHDGAVAFRLGQFERVRDLPIVERTAVATPGAKPERARRS
jgi:hypothetical protein